MARELIVRIIGDASHLERELKKTARTAATFEAQITGIGKSMAKSFGAGLLAGGGVAAMLKLADAAAAATNAASDLNEQTSKSEKVFGQSSAAVLAWSKTTATALGLSQREALAANSTFGLLFRNVGESEESATDLSRSLVRLGADLASLNNTDVPDALAAIRSGLTGEIEPLRRYGVFLSEARTQARALNDTHKDSAKELTTGEKVLARYELLLQDTRIAQGDFAATSTQLANQQRILNAQLDDLQTQIGQALLPVVLDVTTGINKWLSSTENTDRAVAVLKTTVGITATALDGFVTAATLAANATAFFGNKAKAADDKVGGLLSTLARAAASTIPGPVGALLALSQTGGLANTRATTADARSPDTREAALPSGPFGTVGGGHAGQSVKALAALATKAAVQANTWFDARIARMLGRAGDPVSLKEQIGRLRTISSLIGQRLAVTKDITRRLKLEDQQADIAAQIRSRQTEIARNTAAKNKAAAERAKADAATRLETKMGWLDFGIERAGVTKPLGDDRRALRKKEAFLKSLVAHEKNNFRYVTELWRVRQQIRDLNKSKSDKDPLAGLMQASSKQLASVLGSGLGLGTVGMRRLQANVAGAELAPTVVNVHLDGERVGRGVTTHQTRAAARTARQTSGFRG